MEQQLPVALQVALYAASIAMVAFVAILVGMLLHFRKQLERLVGSVEELSGEWKPLAREARGVVKRLGDLSGRAEEQWNEVEGIIETARRWSQRANHLAEEIGAVVEPPILAATRGLGLLRTGIGILVQRLRNRNQLQQQKARES